MKLKKTIAALSAALLLVTAAVPASAHNGRGGHGGNGQINLQAAVNVLGDTAQEALNQSASHQCMGAVMASLGKLDEFHQEKLRLKQEQLQDRVDNGSITQEQADQVVANMQERQENCDGTGYGYCDGSYHENGVCDGTCVNGGICDGTGWGNGNGQGNGLCDGSGQGQGGGYGHGNGQGNGGGRHGGGRGCRN